ncbi:hypothetical protein AVEN_241340-1 [Araneus ventricosus]|uniref:RNase H type-1 domain-containing protein n=1 Tax=Araneus ventricosus TaxID=182803 RepID=A0A4Y2SC35_ARAVE|nr:hypothetical protein AVEN_241340-1 [Araneus ventricosus]
MNFLPDASHWYLRYGDEKLPYKARSRFPAGHKNGVELNYLSEGSSHVPSIMGFLMRRPQYPNYDFGAAGSFCPHWMIRQDGVYTDGSKIDGNVGFSVCIFEGNSLLPVYCYKWNIFNSVFKAELADIDFASGSALDKNVKIKIFTDSKSSIEALKSANIKSNFVLSVKEHLYNAKDLVSLVWVKAHAGSPGNELADHIAKIASFWGTETYIPAPYSFVKRTCNDLLIGEWNNYWTNSVSGRRTKDFFPSVNLDFLINNKYAIYFLTNHRPFPAYLSRFKILDNPNCICSQFGDADHHVSSCIYTKGHHLILPTISTSTYWFNILCRKQFCVNRLNTIFEISRKICDDL